MIEEHRMPTPSPPSSLLKGMYITLLTMYRTLMCATLLELSVDISVFPLDCELLGIVDHDFHSLFLSAWHRETAWYTFVNHIYSRGF